jgi:hypothetical protein
LQNENMINQDKILFDEIKTNELLSQSNNNSYTIYTIIVVVLMIIFIYYINKYNYLLY